MWLQAWQPGPSSNWRASPLPKLPYRLPKPLQDDELAWMAADPGEGVEPDQAGLPDRALVAFLISTGCRISEAGVAKPSSTGR